MGKFAFLIHPLSLEDVWRLVPGASSKRPEILEKFLQWMDPFKMAYVQIPTLRGEIEGWLITVPLLPHQYVNFQNLAIEKIIKACRLASELGADIVGLGAYNSVVGCGGYKLLGRVPLPITSGTNYTVAATLEAIEHVIGPLGAKLDNLRFAVIGATGAIGKTLSYILAERVKHLHLFGRNLSRLEYLIGELRSSHSLRPDIELKAHTDISELRDMDIIISATSSTGGLIPSEVLSPGSIVCDVSLPADVSEEVKRNRTDVLVIDGGWVKLPKGAKVESEFGDTLDHIIGFPPGVILACMAETVILAAEGIFDNFSIGRNVTPERVKLISELVRRHGLKVLKPDISKLPTGFLEAWSRRHCNDIKLSL